jgi:3'(2'), 5'-bisphosphate nucleotidase
MIDEVIPVGDVGAGLEPGAPAESDVAFAARLAREAGVALLELRDGGLEGKALKDAGDAAAQRLLAQALASGRPDDAVLSEEAVDDKARLAAPRVWIIDPLDGTREYSEQGRSDWAVHVALWADGDLVAGAVALPGLDVVLDTASVPAPAPRAVDAPIRIAVSRTRAPELVQQVASTVAAELVPMGSAGYKVSAVVRGEVDAYVHAGGQYEWDSAAPVAVARAAGLHTSRIDGSSLRYNAPDVYLPDLLVCRREIAADLLAAIAAAQSAATNAAPVSDISETVPGGAAHAASAPQEGKA